MREIEAAEITEIVAQLCMNSNFELGEDMIRALDKALSEEESPSGIEVLKALLENARIASEEKIPICQDTGFAVVFVELGWDVRIVGGDLHGAINEGVKKGYSEGYLRKSIVRDPLRRENTGDNTPAVIYADLVPGDRLKITVVPKGGGSENMSGVKMLAPAAGAEGVKDFVVERVNLSGANPCPPVIVGVGIGGTFDKCAQLAKRALLRPVGTPNPDPFYADMESELLRRVNDLGIGPQGLGGRITALAVHIETYPCHIASLPVAVNMQCHASRHKSWVI